MIQSDLPNDEADVSRNTKRPVGRKGDPRMNRAVIARQTNPHMTLIDALLAGGFEFPKHSDAGQSDPYLLDTDGVSLFQRKNQLMRRLRILKTKGKSLSLGSDQIHENRSNMLALGLASEPGTKGTLNISELSENSRTGQSDCNLLDNDSVSVFQRQNQLMQMLISSKSNNDSSSFSSDQAHQKNTNVPSKVVSSDPDTICMIASTTNSHSIPEICRSNSDSLGVANINRVLRRHHSLEKTAGVSELSVSSESLPSSTPQFDSLNVLNSVEQLVKHYQEKDI